MTRPSAASLQVSVIGPSGIETLRRPEPPAELTEEQAVEWKATVNRLAADWFPRETHPMLMQYCRLVVRARRLAQLIDAAESYDGACSFDVKGYRDLVRSEEGVSRAIASLAVRMRLCQVSTVRQDRNKPDMLRKPWQSEPPVDDEED